MDTTIKALQSLYVAIGGELTDTYAGIADGAPVSNYVTIPDIINAIAKIAIPAELPSVTVANAGEVLIVGADGKWNVGSAFPAVTQSNAGEVLMVDESGKWGVDVIPAELPDVTADDDGDMLKVVSGEWAKFTPEP